MKKLPTATVLTVLLIVVSEYILIVWTQNYGADQNVLSHVGFAGTIISIILAVIAILYSYYQTFAQQRDSASLAEQLRHLQTVTATLGESSRNNLQQEQELIAIRAQIQESLDAAKRTEVMVGGIHATVADLKARSDATEQALLPKAKEIAVAAAAVQAFDPPKTAGVIASRAGSNQLAIYLALCHASKNDMTLAQFQQLVHTASANWLKTHNKEASAAILSEWQEGVATGHVDLLDDLKIAQKTFVGEGSTRKLFITVIEAFREAVIDRRKQYLITAEEEASFILGVHAVEQQIVSMQSAAEAAAKI
jgi:hypothetical protein